MPSRFPTPASVLAPLSVVLALGLAPACKRDAPRRATVPSAAPAPAPVAPAPAPADPAADPHEQADELYNSAMMAHESGDKATAEPAIALAVMAYRNLEPLDADELYHLSTLLYAAGKFGEGRQTAERILKEAPTHLLGLGGAARCASAMGDRAAAVQYWRRFLDALAHPEPRPEYEHHERILPIFEKQAREQLGAAPAAPSTPAPAAPAPAAPAPAAPSARP